MKTCKTKRIDIKSFQYNYISNTEKYLLTNLLRSVWIDINTKEIHPQEMDAVSFCAVTDNIFVGYVGIVKWNICIQNKNFRMCGLSCVCTHPLYRKRGIGSDLVKKVTKWIIQNGNFDVGLFTCSPQNTSFYEKIGFWEKTSNLILKESNREGAYQSDIMGLNVFRLLISHKAKRYMNYFENEVINLNFPKEIFI